MKTKIEYIQAAKEAFAHVYDVCPLGSANRCNAFDEKTRMLAEEALIREKKDFDQQVSVIQNQPLLSSKEKHFQIIRLLADIAVRAKAGNCQEMAAVAFLFLLEKHIFPIELVSVPKHTFVIIGRNPETSLDLPESWNKEAVICDPWHRDCVYDASLRFFPRVELMSHFPWQYIDFDGISIGYAQYNCEEEEVNRQTSCLLL